MKFTKLTSRVFSATASSIAKVSVGRPTLSFPLLSRQTSTTVTTTSFYSSIVGRVLADVGNLGKQLSNVWSGGGGKAMEQGSRSLTVTRPAIENGPLILQGKQLLEKFDKLMAIDAPPAPDSSLQAAAPTVIDQAIVALAAAESAKNDTKRVGPFTSTTQPVVANAATASAVAAPVLKKMVPFSANELSLQGGKLKRAKKAVADPPSATVGSIAAAAAVHMQNASTSVSRAVPPRPFSVMDISNVKLKPARVAAAPKQTAMTMKGSLSINDIASVKLRPVAAAAPPKSGAKKRDANKIQSLHSAMKEALNKKFANTRTSIGADSPSANVRW